MNRMSACHEQGCLLAQVLNSKLAVIIGTCELLSRRMTDPAALDSLQTILAAAKSMSDEINKPLVWSESG
jgi:hypothetical protein